MFDGFDKLDNADHIHLNELMDSIYTIATNEHTKSYLAKEYIQLYLAVQEYIEEIKDIMQVTAKKNYISETTKQQITTILIDELDILMQSRNRLRDIIIDKASPWIAGTPKRYGGEPFSKN